MKSVFSVLFISLIAVATVAGCASTPSSSTDSAKQQQRGIDKVPSGY